MMVVKFYDPIGLPQCAFGVSDFVEASLVVQLATTVGDGSRASTIQIRDGDAFSMILDPSLPALPGTDNNAESFVVMKADIPEAAVGYKKQRLRVVKLLASTPRTLVIIPSPPPAPPAPADNLTAYDDFEIGTLNGGHGWVGPAIVYTRPPVTAYEDFETSSLSGGGSDFGWAGPRIIYSR